MSYQGLGTACWLALQPHAPCLTKGVSGVGPFPWEHMLPSPRECRMQHSGQAHLLKDLPHLLVEAHGYPVDGPVQPSPAQPLALPLPPANVMTT